jgi:hypothetical protein
MSWLSRVVNVFRERRLQREWDEELRFHVEARTDDLVRDGMMRGEAEAEAARRLGPTLLARDESRDIRLLPWLDALLRDVRFGLRVLRKHAIVSAAAVVSLSLAIGAVTAAFSLIDALILRPLPVRQPEQLHYLTYDEEDGQGRPDEWESFSLGDLKRLREAAAPSMPLFGVSYLTMQSVVFADANGAAGGEAERIRTQYMTGDAMPQLGLRPALGRLLTAEDDRVPRQHPVAVISHRLWTRRFEGAADALGRWLTLDGNTTVQIVGVGPEGFTGIEPGRATDIWLPTMMSSEPESAGHQWLRLRGRLPADAAAAPAQARMQAAFTASREAMVRGIDTRNLPADRIKRFVASALHLRSAANGPSPLRRGLARPLWVLAFVAGLVLLVACSNVANLMMARAAARERERRCAPRLAPAARGSCSRCWSKADCWRSDRRCSGCSSRARRCRRSSRCCRRPTTPPISTRVSTGASSPSPPSSAW